MVRTVHRSLIGLDVCRSSCSIQSFLASSKCAHQTMCDEIGLQKGGCETEKEHEMPALVSLCSLPRVVDASHLLCLLPCLRRLNDGRSQLTGAIHELQVAQRRIVTITAAHVDHAREAGRTESAPHTTYRDQQLAQTLLVQPRMLLSSVCLLLCSVCFAVCSYAYLCASMPNSLSMASLPRTNAMALRCAVTVLARA